MLTSKLMTSLLSKIPHHPNSFAKDKTAKPPLNYLHVSTKVVTWKDAEGVEHEGLVGVTYVKPKE